MKRKILPIVTFLLPLFLSFKSNAQTEIDSKLKKLFFDLTIDSCLITIEKEIESSKVYKFQFVGDIDTFNIADSIFYLKNNLLSSYYKLVNNEQSLVDCDSTFISLQRAIVAQSAYHKKRDFETLYGHRIITLMYLSDSIKAYKTYKNLVYSISNNLNRNYSSGDFTIDNIVMGNSTTMNIDKKNNGYEYKRDIEISIRKYPKLYELKVEFVKLTIRPENCKE